MKEEQDTKKELLEDFALSDQGLKEAVKSVYRRYGTNLSEFFEDAYEDERERRERARTNRKLEACPL